jgi:hypothetical protein
MRERIGHHGLKELLQPPISPVKTVTNVVDLNDQELISKANRNLHDLHLVFILFKLAAVDKVAWRISILLEWI